MDPSWLLVTFVLIVQAVLCTILVLPLPSNHVRMLILKMIYALWGSPAVKWAAVLSAVLNGYYLFWILRTYRHNLLSPVDQSATCMQEVTLMRSERNLFITAGNLWLSLVLRRLVQLQEQLHRARQQAKEHDQIGKIIKKDK